MHEAFGYSLNWKITKASNALKRSSLFSPLLRVPCQGLINKDTGAPQEMAGLATHLHYHEPSNFVLVSFLQRGLFHEFCEPDKNGKKNHKL